MVAHDYKIMADSNDLGGLEALIAKQQALGRWVTWLLVLPFIVIIAAIPLTYSLAKRISEVELGSKLLTIERILDKDQNFSWAITEYEKVAETHQTAPIMTRLGMLYFLQDENHLANLAIQKLQLAITIDSTYWEAYSNLAYIYTLLDQPDKAIEAANNALKYNGLDANTYNNLAWLYATTKHESRRNLGKALDYAKTALRLTKEQQASFLDTAAEIYVSMGGADNRTKGEQYFKKALTLALPKERGLILAHVKERFPEFKAGELE